MQYRSRVRVHVDDNCEEMLVEPLGKAIEDLRHKDSRFGAVSHVSISVSFLVRWLTIETTFYPLPEGQYADEVSDALITEAMMELSPPPEFRLGVSETFPVRI